MVFNQHRKDYHFIESGSCDYCNLKREDTINYRLVCHSFAAQREEMLQSISKTLPDITTHILALKDKYLLSQKFLFGTGSFEIDVKLFNIVEIYMGNPTISVNLIVGMFEVTYLNLYKFHECLIVFS